MINVTDAPHKRICIVATVPIALKLFMTSHIVLLKEKYDVTLVANGSADDLSGLLDRHVSFIGLQIERKISIKKDVIALIKLWRLFRRKKFVCVCSLMPKAGLLAMLAARFAGVQIRLNIFNGEVWANKKGLMGCVLKGADKIIACSASKLLAVSPSERLFLIKNNIVKSSKIEVVAHGSITGVDVHRFKYSAKAHDQIRFHNNIPSDAIVFLFVGRLNHDKGLMDLSRAFAIVAEQNVNLHLMVVGPDEEGLEVEFSALAQRFPGRVHRVGFTDTPENYMSAADALCLPSHREGFGSVIIEAASVGLPAIASRIYGITDAVEDGVTGILHQPTSGREIAEAMLLLASNDDLRHRMGAAARERVAEKFSEARVTKAFADFYRNMFGKRDLTCDCL